MDTTKDDTLATVGVKLDIPSSVFIGLGLVIILPIVIYFLMKKMS